MWKVAALVHMPVWAVLFGFSTIALLSTSWLANTGAPLLYVAAGVTFIVSIPISWFVARRMMTRRERRAEAARQLG